MNVYLTAILLGLGFSCLAFGIYISMRIFNIPDITTDGSFTLGGSVTAVLLIHQHSWVAVPCAFAAGFLAGMITGSVNALLRVNDLLSGILVMTALYSVNLAVMQRPNIPLIGIDMLFGSGTSFAGSMMPVAVLVVLVVAGLSWLLQTDFGLAMRATGNNESMMRALGTDTRRMKILGLGLANGLVALGGSIISQLQGYTDINMGVGIVILGLGSVILGELLLLGRQVPIVYRLAAVAFGTIFFRILLAFALSLGIDPVYLKLIIALLVLACIAWPSVRKTNG